MRAPTNSSTASTSAPESFWYRTVDTPVGSLLLATTETGVVRVAFTAEDHEAVLADLSARLGVPQPEEAGRLDEAVRQLAEYFVGQRRGFTVALDLRLSRGFRRTVLEQLSGISYGQTVSYATVAVAAGRPTAVRAVGTACATNPLPVLLPCHRVVRSDGSVGQYLGGVAVKQTLLALEANLI
jgi:methylated-DNA-[protein]-cysteine S-methyltransferase